ncbi:hypothetical protein [Paenibacillus barcinonensis]|nr:hypothetical protein [Paenibacillus barcinonensis]
MYCWIGKGQGLTNTEASQHQMYYQRTPYPPPISPDTLASF